MCDPNVSVNDIGFSSDNNCVDFDFQFETEPVVAGGKENAPGQPITQPQQNSCNCSSNPLLPIDVPIRKRNTPNRKLRVNADNLDKDDYFFSGAYFTIFSFDKYSHKLVRFVFDDGCYLCSKSRIFRIFPHIKVDKISIKLETNNEDPCLFINELNVNTCTIEPMFTILYQSSQEYKDRHYPESFTMKSKKGAKVTNAMKNIIHTLTIDCLIDNKIVYSHQFQKRKEERI